MATADQTGVRGRDLAGYIELFRTLYRERFGEDMALEDETVAVRTFPARVVDGHVQVRHQSCAKSSGPARA